MKSDSDGAPDNDDAAARDERDDASLDGGDIDGSDAYGGDDGDDISGRDIAAGIGASGQGRLADSELQTAAVGARVSAGSARAAARASTARAGLTPGKGRATPSRDRGPSRGNIFVRIVRYLREVVSEMRKVIWPTRKEMITYSIVVVLFLVFMIAVTWSLDLGFARAVLAIFG